METLAGAVARARRAWGWMLAYGILLIIVGWFAAFNPIATNVAVGTLLAVVFVFGGVGSIMAAFRDFGWQAKLVDIAFGVLALLGALIMFANPFVGSLSLVWAAGFFFFLSGIVELVSAARATSDRWWLILLGVVDVALGAYVAIFMPPGAAMITLAWFIGIGFIIRGVILSALAIQLRSAPGYHAAG